MQLLQAMSEEEKYEGAQGGHNARMFFGNPPTLPEGGRNVSRVGLEFSYSTGATAPWGGGVK
jgi:hypothetical protein